MLLITAKITDLGQSFMCSLLVTVKKGTRIILQVKFYALTFLFDKQGRDISTFFTYLPTKFFTYLLRK